MNCKDARFKISEWIDGSLEATEISKLKAIRQRANTVKQVYDDLKEV
ncbi:MAG: hypothetical protein U0V70_18425 [Terriglobia bacterium]